MVLYISTYHSQLKTHNPILQSNSSMPRSDRHHGRAGSERSHGREGTGREPPRPRGVPVDEHGRPNYLSSNLDSLVDHHGKTRSQTHAIKNPTAWQNDIASFDDFFLREVALMDKTYGAAPCIILNAFQIGLVEGLIEQLDGYNRFDFSKLKEKFPHAVRQPYFENLNGGRMSWLPGGGRNDSRIGKGL